MVLFLFRFCFFLFFFGLCKQSNVQIRWTFGWNGYKQFALPFIFISCLVAVAGLLGIRMNMEKMKWYHFCYSFIFFDWKNSEIHAWEDSTFFLMSNRDSFCMGRWLLLRTFFQISLKTSYKRPVGSKKSLSYSSGIFHLELIASGKNSQIINSNNLCLSSQCMPPDSHWSRFHHKIYLVR